jgi:bacteriocin-like protein
MHELSDQELEQVVGGVEVGGNTSTSSGQPNETLPGQAYVGSRAPSIDDWFDFYWFTHPLVH